MLIIPPLYTPAAVGGGAHDIEGFSTWAGTNFGASATVTTPASVDGDLILYAAVTSFSASVTPPTGPATQGRIDYGSGELELFTEIPSGDHGSGLSRQFDRPPNGEIYVAAWNMGPHTVGNNAQGSLVSGAASTTYDAPTVAMLANGKLITAFISQEVTPGSITTPSGVASSPSLPASEGQWARDQGSSNNWRMELIIRTHGAADGTSETTTYTRTSSGTVNVIGLTLGLDP